MRRIIIFLFILSIGFSFETQAQIDRSKAPNPAPPREIKLRPYQSFIMKNGLQVFVVEDHKLPRIQFTLSLKNNPVLEGEKAGYVAITGDLIGTGTTNHTKAQLDEEIDFIGASLNTSASGIFASSLTRHKDKLLNIMADVLLHPSFPAEELDKLKTQTLSSIAAEKSDPEAISEHVSHVLYYGKNHPYGELTTEKTIEVIRLEDCKNYYKTYFVPSNAYLAIVGDIDLKTAKAICKKYFEGWPKGNVSNPAYKEPTAPKETTVALVDRPASVQSVIQIGYPLTLPPGNPDMHSVSILDQILGGGISSRLVQNLREEKGYTYSAYSTFDDDPLIGSFVAGASVRNEVTDSSIHEFITEMEKIKLKPVTDHELESAKAALIGAFGRALERPQTVARFAINTAKYNLPKDYYTNYVKDISAVTKENVQQVAKKYLMPEHSYIVVVGKGTEVAEKLEKFSKVQYYDDQGNAYTPKTSTIPEGLTAEKVIDNYLTAIGGKNKVEFIKTIRMNYQANAMGSKLLRTDTKMAPMKSRIEVKVDGNLFQQSVGDGKNVSVKIMGQKMPLDAKMEQMQLFSSSLFKELAYQKLPGTTIKLEGTQQIDGQDAFVVEINLPLGEKVTEYYSQKNGLKLQTVQTVNSPQGPLVITQRYKDYKEVEGILLPFTIEQSQGQVNIKFEMTSVELNVAIDDAHFKVEE